MITFIIKMETKETIKLAIKQELNWALEFLEYEE